MHHCKPDAVHGKVTDQTTGDEYGAAQEPKEIRKIHAQEVDFGMFLLAGILQTERWSSQTLA